MEKFRRPIFSDAERYVDVQITSAQLLALNATPQTLIAAPGSSEAHIPLGIMMFLDYNSAAYAGIATAEDLVVRYTNGSGNICLTVEATGFLDQTADQLRWGFPTATITPTAAAALVIHMATGEVTTGNSPLNTRLYYRTVPTVF
jgi:hypothetical protein